MISKVVNYNCFLQILNIVYTLLKTRQHTTLHFSKQMSQLRVN